MIKKIGLLFFMLLSFGIATLGGILLYAFILGPPDTDVHHPSAIYDQHDQMLQTSPLFRQRETVSLDEISPHLIDAFIAAEDQHFFDHFGFDLKRIGAATIQNVIHQDKVQGASTISQQYARNLFLSPEKTWTRKIKEALATVRLEMFLTKEDILEGYLNSIYFGHGQYGIEAASRFFLDKGADDLTLEEAALLAAIPKGPSVYSPLNNEEKAFERQEWILGRMASLDMIDSETLSAALEKNVPLVAAAHLEERSYGLYFMDYALNEASNKTGISREELEQGGYHIHTTMDLDAQRHLEGAVHDHLPENDLQIGAVTIDQHTGRIIAMQGGRDFVRFPFNRSVDAKRMTGSSFKPYLYYAALVYGFTPSTTLESQETTFQLEDGSVYEPSNFGDLYADGPMTLAQAIALSDNIYAIKTNLFITPENLIEASRSFGIDEELPNVLSLALGTASVSVIDMADGYSRLGNGGYEIEPYAVEKIVSEDGEVVYENEPDPPKRVLDAKYSFVLTHLLKGIFDERLNGYMRVTGASIAPQLTHHYAGKTGSTPNDHWMIGYSPSYTTAVWTGYDDHREIEERQDHQVARNVWSTYMEKLHADVPRDAFPVPEGVNGVYVDPISGALQGPACEDRSMLMYFVQGTEPKEVCSE